MTDKHSSRPRLPKGVSALKKSRGGRAYRATIRKGKGVEVHLGLYETPWLAAFAFGVAARAIGRNNVPELEVPRDQEPSAEQVIEITEKVRRRLGRDGKRARRQETEQPPATEDLLALFEITVVGFWRGEAAHDSNGPPGAGLDAAAGRVVEAARLLFWSRSAGHPEPLDAMTRLLARRLDGAFRRAELTREVLDDDGDDPWRVARWLVHPEAAQAGGRVRSFREEIRMLYDDFVVASSTETRPSWAEVLGVVAPFDPDQVRMAYRVRSREAHPDTGGNDAAFVRLSEAYEEAKAYFSSRGL